MLTFYHLGNGLHQADNHYDTTKRNARIGSIRLPCLPLRELDEAKRRQNVRQRTRARRTDEFEHNADVARDQRQCHRRHDQRRGEDEVAVGIVRLAGEVILGHDFAADEALQRQRGDHVQPEAEARDVDHDVVGGKVVEHIALGHVAEGDVAAQRH